MALLSVCVSETAAGNNVTQVSRCTFPNPACIPTFNLKALHCLTGIHCTTRWNRLCTVGVTSQRRLLFSRGREQPIFPREIRFRPLLLLIPLKRFSQTLFERRQLQAELPL